MAVLESSYFFNSLGMSIKSLEPYRKLSPFYYFIGADPLANGLNWGHAAVLIILTLVFLGLAVIAFNRRDLAV